MNVVIELSKLLREADQLNQKAGQLSHSQGDTSSPAQWQEFEQSYRTWYEQALALLPDDLREPFVSGLMQSLFGLPALTSVFAWKTQSQPEASTTLTQEPSLSRWDTHQVFVEAIRHQREQIFFARRRAWGDRSTLPTGMQATLANICKQIFQLQSIEEVFIRNGSESHWPIPPFQPDPRSERINEALSWLDGTAVYAPERERAIVRGVCESILARPALTKTVRATVEGLLAQLDQAAQPAPPASNPLDRYPVHPTVRRIAAPLMAGGHHSEAILKVCIALNLAVQAATGTNLDGSALMQQAFSPKAPLLRLGQTEAEQQGWMHLYTGLIMALRNPRAHRHVDDTDEAATIEWLMFASALFRALDAAVVAAPPGSPSSSP
ncbi:MAG TPA: TIGR02391 family protein [Roseiflexaceae bacterium]|nr:TIGR02391 family protein [Roseiflexaceae bacterium]